jgi:hypothetical protein
MGFIKFFLSYGKIYTAKKTDIIAIFTNSDAKKPQHLPPGLYFSTLRAFNFLASAIHYANKNIPDYFL